MKNFKKLMFMLTVTLMITMMSAGVAFAQEGSTSLSKPTVNAPVRTDKSVVKLSWSKVIGAEYYKIYRTKDKSGPYHYLAKTTKTAYSDKSGKAKKTYYYRIVAVGRNADGKLIKSDESKVVSAKVRVTPKRIAYVGDSIMEGFTSYGVISNTSAHKVIAKVGIQTYNFVSSSYMTSLLNYNPDRIYICLGINGVGRSYIASYYEYTVKYYKKIIDKCIRNNRNVEIVIIPVTPVSRVSTVSNGNRKEMNTLIRKMYKKYYAKNPNIKYWNVDSLLTGSDGYLLSKYNAGDGVHWTPAGYQMMYKQMKKYGKNWK